MKWFALLFVFLFQTFSSLGEEPQLCDIPPGVLEEIKHHQSFADEVIKAATEGEYSGRVYNDLMKFVDRFGNRMAGSNELEDAINYLGDQMKKELKGMGEVTVEEVKVPVWERGKEEGLVAVGNSSRKLRILGLSPSTSIHVKAPLIVVNDFEELEAKSEEIEGKIVLFNAKFTTYEDTVKYRIDGPAKASALGALATLVRSITPFSIGSLHTGWTSFDAHNESLAAAEITLEDADYLDRIYREGNEVLIILSLTSQIIGKGNSSNLIFDYPGSVEPQSYAVVSGHTDSWDVGEGALDDGSGVFVSLHSLLLLKHLKVKPPRRTFRAILWTANEPGYIGAKTYLEKHREELKNWTAAYETDRGIYSLLGLSLAGNKNSSCILKEVLSLFKNINATALNEVKYAGSDITVFQPLGVPLIEPFMVDNNYYWFQHTDGDSMRTLNSTIMDQHLAMATVTTYVLANLSIPLRDIDNHEIED